MHPVGPLPAGYTLEGDAARGWYVVRSDVADDLAACGFGLDGDGARVTTDLGGRGALERLDAPGLAARGVTALLRHMRRGGLAARFGRTRFSDPRRPFDELRLSDSLRGDGVRTPAVLAARALPRDGAWDLALVVEEVLRADDLAVAFAAAPPARRHALARATGRFVGELFDAGLDHRDLHPKNMLAERADPGATAPVLWVLDLDRCVRRDGLTDARRDAALARCLRWCLRRRVELGFTRTDALRFLVAHLPDGADWRAAWHLLQRRAERRVWMRFWQWK